MNDEQRLQQSREYWDNIASSFDDEPDHGLRDAILRETWTTFLRESLPYTRARILDIGCGTGSLSVVLAGLGHTITGIDLSPAMISLARTKVETLEFEIEFHIMDAALPSLPSGYFDAIVCRHLLWTLPHPQQVLQKWADLLKPKGRLILVEGYWATSVGLQSNQITEILPSSFENFSVQDLSHNVKFWGKAINDERYAIIADKNK